MNGKGTFARPASARLKRSLGSNRVVVWAIKHIVSPIDRLTVKVGRGRIPPPTSLAVPTLLLTTVGRRSGLKRTIPLVFVPDGDAYVVGNARPVGERRNPWVLNLRASGSGTVRHDGRTRDVIAHELGADELERWWRELAAAWPAFETHYAGTGERSVFRLEPVESHDRFAGR